MASANGVASQMPSVPAINDRLLITHIMPIGESGSSHFAIYGGNVLSTGVKELISVHKSKPVDNTFVRVANSKLFWCCYSDKKLSCVNSIMDL